MYRSRRRPVSLPPSHSIPRVVEEPERGDFDAAPFQILTTLPPIRFLDACIGPVLTFFAPFSFFFSLFKDP